MAVYVITDAPKLLLRHLKRKIDDGVIRTWEYDEDGDFTHSAAQWKTEAWLHPYLREDKLIFGILPPFNKVISREIYSIYMGRMVEALINHCHNLIDNIRISPNPSMAYDKMSSGYEE